MRSASASQAALCSSCSLLQRGSEDSSCTAALGGGSQEGGGEHAPAGRQGSVLRGSTTQEGARLPASALAQAVSQAALTSDSSVAMEGTWQWSSAAHTARTSG